MSKLMSVLGILLLAIGLALGLLEIVNPGKVQSIGVSMDTAVTLLVGGILAIGLGGVIAALEQGVMAAPMEAFEEEAEAEAGDTAAEPENEAPAPAAEAAPTKVRFPGFGRKAAATATAATATATAETSAASSAVQDTIDALEKAKQDIKGALGGVETMLPDDQEEPEAPTAEEVMAEGELYVVEERTIRGRPARILSDNTVEAETDEGWMRFENLEHLNEYLDAAGE
jgi:hypothetical protein